MTLFSPEKRVSPKKRKILGGTLFFLLKKRFPLRKKETFAGENFFEKKAFSRIPPFKKLSKLPLVKMLRIFTKGE